MKKLLLLVLVLSMGACSTEPLFTTNPTEPKDSHIICESKFYETQNTTEQWMEGKWIQTGDYGLLFFGAYFEITFDSTKKQWIKNIISNKDPIDIFEASYQIKENFWNDTTGTHFLDIAYERFSIEEPNSDLNKLFFLEIEKVTEDKIIIYDRGYNLGNLPPDFDEVDDLDPQQAKRYSRAIYQRVK